MNKQIVEFTTQKRLPGVVQFREFTELGGLMSYGPSLLGVPAHARAERCPARGPRSFFSAGAGGAASAHRAPTYGGAPSSLSVIPLPDVRISSTGAES